MDYLRANSGKLQTRKGQAISGCPDHDFEPNGMLHFVDAPLLCGWLHFTKINGSTEIELN
jgi:hypothetical protein